MRSGLWMTGSGGSGILIARKSDGTWSPPSGIMLHTPTLSFIIGVDIYDCVLVVSNLAALESITRPRVTLGEDVALTNGPIVPMQSDEMRVSWRDLGNTVLAYMKARGQHQEVNLNGCILTERANENERFYDGNITQMDVLAGNVARHVEETQALFEVIKMAEGRTDFDRAVIDKTAALPAPGDAVIETPKATPASLSPRPSFGIPQASDPDPFGVLALEMAGLEIREAGSRLRPASSQLEYHPSPLSPVLSKFSRQSIDSRSNRGSYMSTRTVKSHVSDIATQTDTRGTSPSPQESEEETRRVSGERGADERRGSDVDYTTVDMSSLRHISKEYASGSVKIPEETVHEEHVVDVESVSSAGSKSVNGDEKTSGAEHSADNEDSENDDGDDDVDLQDAEDEDEDDEEPVVFEVAEVQPARTQAVASRMIQARGNVVNIPKRTPPPLPKRSPARQSRLMKNELGAEFKSPLRQAFSEADLIPEMDKADQESQPDDAKSTGDLEEVSSLDEITATFSGSERAIDAVAAETSNAPEEIIENDVEAKQQDSKGIEEVEDEQELADDKTEKDENEKNEDTEQDEHDKQNDEPSRELVTEDASAEKTAGEAEPDVDSEAEQDAEAKVDSQAGTHELGVAATGDSTAAVEDMSFRSLINEDALEQDLELGSKQEETDAAIESTKEAETVDVKQDTTEENKTDAASERDVEETTEGHGKHTEEEDSETEDDSLPLDTFAPMESRSPISDDDDDEDPFELEHTVTVTKSPRQDDEDEFVKHDYSNAGTDETLDDDEPRTPHNEHTEAFDSASHTKHSSSLFTGNSTDDRWSYDGSMFTTPTSDRAHSPSGSPIKGTPKKGTIADEKEAKKPVEIREDVETSTEESGDITPTVPVH